MLEKRERCGAARPAGRGGEPAESTPWILWEPKKAILLYEHEPTPFVCLDQFILSLSRR